MPTSPLAAEDCLLVQSLYVDHQPWLLGRLQQRLRNLAEAEDVSSETFVQVIGGRRLVDLREPRAFLTTVAKRVLFDVWRRRDLEKAYVDACAHLPEQLSPSAEERALAMEALFQVVHALEKLSERARQAFLLSQLDGLGYAEIADRLGVSASMVRKYMVQGWRACALATA